MGGRAVQNGGKYIQVGLAAAYLGTDTVKSALKIM
jgi:hypothetical protein